MLNKMMKSDESHTNKKNSHNSILKLYTWERQQYTLPKICEQF